MFLKYRPSLRIRNFERSLSATKLYIYEYLRLHNSSYTPITMDNYIKPNWILVEVKSQTEPTQIILEKE